MYDRLLNIFERFLGETRRGVSDNGQCQFNCVNCDSDGDNKYNLEISFSKGIYKCWKCEKSGKLSKLIREFGNEIIFQEYKNEIEDLRNSRLYQLHNKNEFADLKFGEDLFAVPNCCQKINPNWYKHKKAFDYCNQRGLNLDIINKYNIQCTTFECDDWRMRNRIVIPSYDKFNSLNYWISRIYKDNKYQTKHLNPDKNKKNIIFNEYLINWDGDIKLVEGGFDHIVIPNSIPILGKELDNTFYLYHQLMEKANSVTLIGDGEAFTDWLDIYKNLNTGKLKNKISICKLPKNEDPSSIYKKYGNKGIAKLLHNSYKINKEILF